MYVNGLRKDVGQAMAAFDRTKTMAPPLLCAKCGCDDESMIEVRVRRRPSDRIGAGPRAHVLLQHLLARVDGAAASRSGRFASIEDVVQRTGLRRDELTTLADIGALNAFTNERRSALWQVERAVRPAGELFDGDRGRRATSEDSERSDTRHRERSRTRSDRSESHCDR